MKRITTVLASLVALCGCSSEVPLPAVRGMAAAVDAVRPFAEPIAESVAEPIAVRRAGSNSPSAAPGGAALRRRGNGVTGRIKLRFSPLARELLGPDFWNAFRGSAPGVEVDFLRGSNDSSLAEVAARRADVALVALRSSGAVIRAGLRDHLLGVRVIAVVVRRECPLRTLSSDQLGAILRGEVRAWHTVAHGPGEIAPAFGMPTVLAQAVRAQILPGDAGMGFVQQFASASRAVRALTARQAGLAVVAWSVANGRTDLRAVAIGGVAPSGRALRQSRYPLGLVVQLATADAATPAARLLTGFATGPVGRRVIARALCVD